MSVTIEQGHRCFAPQIIGAVKLIKEASDNEKIAVLNYAKGVLCGILYVIIGYLSLLFSSRRVAFTLAPRRESNPGVW